MPADFSIVTPSFNQVRFVGRTLDSVRGQTGVTVQHVVVDPGSTDGSRDIVRAAPGITLVEKKDSCQSEGINNGFAECRGRYMSWLNSDDQYASPQTLEIVKRCFESDPGIDIVYGNAVFVDENGDFLRHYYVNGHQPTLGASFEHQVGICQPAVFWRREVYERLGGLDESLDYQLDYEYWIRFHQAGFRWKHVNTVLAAHRWWDGMKTASRRDLSLRESLNLVKQKFGYVHWKWADRLAALEVEASDGIINVAQGQSQATKVRALEILRQVDTDACTLRRMAAPQASPGMTETLARLRDGGVDVEPRFADARSLSFDDAEPRFLAPDDAAQPSRARRPELRRCAEGEMLVYGAEPDFVIAQTAARFHAEQTRLADYLAQARAGPEKTCVVVANGPSLNRSLDDALFGLDLIISNFAYKDERLLRHAKYFTIVNHTVAAQIRADWMQLERIDKVFPFWLGWHVPALANTYYVNATVKPGFSPDARRGLSWRSTVSYFNLQLAYSLGYRRILLVGFDHAYQQPESVKEGDELVQTADDPNHFLPGYFKGKTWQAADTGNMNDSYCEALAFSMAHDVEIVNCTAGGQLHVFPRGRLAEAAGDVARPGLKLLTPGEIALVARWPEARAVFSGAQPPRYADLPEAWQAMLLEQARLAGRGHGAPHGDLRAQA